MIKPAIVAVGYNRPMSMKRLLASICVASYPVKDITLIISIDESSKSDEIQNIAEKVQWNYGEKIIRRFSKRQGLRNHVLKCGDLSQEYGAVIVLEDDLIVSNSYYYFVYEAVNYYKNEKNIAGISLYSHAWNGYALCHFSPQKSPYDTYLGKYSISWGQCWLKDRWADFRKWYTLHEDKLPLTNNRMPENISHWNKHSWGKYFATYVVEKDIYYVIPYDSMSTNFSEIGEHNKVMNTAHQVSLLEGVKKTYVFPPYQEAVKYDIFFERIFDVVNGINGDEICVDINGLKRTTNNKKYILTTKKLPYKKIASFGMIMRPVDLNIIHLVSGNDIYLYQCNSNDNIPICCYSKSRKEYETYDISWKILLEIGIKRFYESLGNHIRLIFKNIFINKGKKI